MFLVIVVIIQVVQSSPFQDQLLQVPGKVLQDVLEPASLRTPAKLDSQFGKRSTWCKNFGQLCKLLSCWGSQGREQKSLEVWVARHNVCDARFKVARDMDIEICQTGASC
ncbi:hypothetical protein B0O80DRAFT_442311 [Mortierella sp. GBAus27b]|nr:hypothetical protein B0O80DRAFT_442311 [Mortierella sp. GBAus27b]